MIWLCFPAVCVIFFALGNNTPTVTLWSRDHSSADTQTTTNTLKAGASKQPGLKGTGLFRQLCHFILFKDMEGFSLYLLLLLDFSREKLIQTTITALKGCSYHSHALEQ